MDNEISDPDPNTEYACSPYIESKGFTKLMKLVMMTGKNPELISDIKNMIIYDKNIIDIKNEKGWTPLMLAARNSDTDSNIDTVKLLIECGANIKSQNNDGWTTLMMAVRCGNMDDSNLNIIKILIESGANLNIQNNGKLTALMMAAQFNNTTNNNIETVKLLIDAGADIYLMNNQGKTVLELNNDIHVKIVKLHTEYQIKLTEIKTIKKINFDRTLRYIPLGCNEIKFKPDNIGSKIMKISFKMKTTKIKPLDIYQKMINKNNFILDYLSITSFDHFASKINEYLITQ